MFSNLKEEPRVIRQIDVLKERFSVTTLGLRKSDTPGVKEFILSDNRSIGKRLKSRLLFLLSRLFNHLYLQYNKLKYPTNEVIEMLSNEKFDLIIANGLEVLIVAEKIALRDDAEILLDAHEYEPRRIEDRWFHNLFVNPYKEFLCRRYLSPRMYMTTVSFGIADEFFKTYGVKPDVILNAPKYQRIELKKVESDKIHLIHHGVAHSSRNLEDLINLMPLLEERFHLTLMLVIRDVGYFNYLKGLCNKVCPERIDFRKPVPFDEIIPAISEYDIGLIIYRPTSFNIKHALPNKFFESITAGLALVIGPSPEMKNIIEKFNCGVFSNSFNIKEIAKLINSLTPKQIMEKKKGSLEAAKFLNSEREMKKLHRIVRMILS